MDLSLFVGAPRAVFASHGMGRWCACTVDGNLPDRPRCPVRQPCGSRTGRPHDRRPRRAIGSQQLPGLRVDRLCGPPLTNPSFSSFALAVAQSAPPAARPWFAVGCVRAVVTPAASLAFLGGSVIGAPARAPAMDHRPQRPGGQPSQPPHPRNPHPQPPRRARRQDERNALVRWAVLLQGVIG
jgi:hypothetical protein